MISSYPLQVLLNLARFLGSGLLGGGIFLVYLFLRTFAVENRAIFLAGVLLILPLLPALVLERCQNTSPLGFQRLGGWRILLDVLICATLASFNKSRALSWERFTW